MVKIAASIENNASCNLSKSERFQRALCTKAKSTAWKERTARLIY